MLGAFLLVGCLLFVRLGGWKGWRCVVSCMFGGLRASLRDGACYVEFSELFAEKLFVWSLFHPPDEGHDDSAHEGEGIFIFSFVVCDFPSPVWAAPVP